MEVLQNIIYWSIIVVGFTAIMAGLMYGFMYLSGKIIQYTGHYKLFYKTLMAIAKDIRKDKERKV